MIGCSKGTNKINRKRLLDKRVKEILFGSVDLSPIRNRWRHGIVRLSLPRFHAENKTRELREKSLGEIFLGQLQSSYIWFWGSSVPAPCARNFFYMVLISSRKIFNENKTALFSLNLVFDFLLLKNWRKRKKYSCWGRKRIWQLPPLILQNVRLDYTQWFPSKLFLLFFFIIV